MTTFQQLLSFHDPELSHHLNEIGLRPELYAIPWFMTLFAHVLPLDKIYWLWDNFLVGPAFAPLYAALGIVEQMRESLMYKDFNVCMLLFSELPAIEIEQVIHLMFEVSHITPPSSLSHLSDLENVEENEFLRSDIDRVDLPKYVPVHIRRNVKLE